MSNRVLVFSRLAALVLLGLFWALPVHAAQALDGALQPMSDVVSIQAGGDEGTLAAALGLFCLLLLMLLGVGVFIVAFLGKRKRKHKRKSAPAVTTEPAPTAVAAPASRPSPEPSMPPATPEVDWRADTILRPPVASRMSLVVTAGDSVGQRFPLLGVTRIGRVPENEVALPDPQISRQHAVINFNGAQFEILDLGGANGTEVNGRAIQAPTPLLPGDVIDVGGHSLTVEGE
jgi:hypothetical protein